MFRLKKNNQKQGFVDPSPWPLLGAFAALMSIFGGVLYMHGYLGGEAVYSLGFFMMFFFVFWMLSRLSCVRLLLGKISLGLIFFLLINKNFFGVASCEGEESKIGEPLLFFFFLISAILIILIIFWFLREHGWHVKNLKERIQKLSGELKTPLFGRVVLLLVIGWVLKYSGIMKYFPNMGLAISLMLTFFLYSLPREYFLQFEQRLLGKRWFQFVTSYFCGFETFYFGSFLGHIFISAMAGFCIVFTILFSDILILQIYGTILYMLFLLYLRFRSTIFVLDALAPSLEDEDIRKVSGQNVYNFFVQRVGDEKKVVAKYFLKETYVLGRISSPKRGMLTGALVGARRTFVGGVAAGAMALTGWAGKERHDSSVRQEQGVIEDCKRWKDDLGRVPVYSTEAERRSKELEDQIDNLRKGIEKTRLDHLRVGNDSSLENRRSEMQKRINDFIRTEHNKSQIIKDAEAELVAAKVKGEAELVAAKAGAEAAKAGAEAAKAGAEAAEYLLAEARAKAELQKLESVESFAESLYRGLYSLAVALIFPDWEPENYEPVREDEDSIEIKRAREEHVELYNSEGRREHSERMNPVLEDIRNFGRESLQRRP